MTKRGRPSSWTPEREARARQMFADGYSTTEITRTLGEGLTRSAVAGKLHRLGCFQKRATPYKPREEKPREKPAPKAKAAPKPKPRNNNPRGVNGRTKSLQGHRPNVIKGVQGAQKTAKAVPQPQTVQDRMKAAQTANPDSRGVPLEDLTSRCCRWAVNEAKPGEPHLFCGARTEPGRSFCDQHHAIAYVGPPPKRKPAEDVSGFLDDLHKRRRPTLRAV